MKGNSIVKGAILFAAIVFLPAVLFSVELPEGGFTPDYIVDCPPRKSEIASIKGVVCDRIADEPLPGVTVQINKHNLGTVTDADGSFIIADVPDGVVRLWFSMVGYRTICIHNLRIYPDSDYVLIVFLPIEAFPLGKETTIKGHPRGMEFGGRRYTRHINRERIIDIETGMPLFDVQVWNKSMNRSAKSNIKGRCSIVKTTRWAWDLQFTCPGYDTLLIYNVNQYKKNWDMILPIELTPAMTSFDRRRHAYDSAQLKRIDAPQIIKK